MKTGILCHGRHLLANNWELHQWGDMEKGLLGQILKTCLLTHQENPRVIVFGTGASEKDGLKESEYTIQYMLDRFPELEEFPQFKEIDLLWLEKFIIDHFVAETKSQNTYEELRYAGQIFDSHGIEKVILVSNPDHISRCMQLAHQVYQETHLPSLANVFASQSDIGYLGEPRATSAVIETPHRGDDLSPDLSQIIKKYFGLSLEAKEEFVDQLRSFIKTHK